MPTQSSPSPTPAPAPGKARTRFLELRLPGVPEQAAALALAALAYWQALGPMARLLQRRETRILAVVTVEVE